MKQRNAMINLLGPGLLRPNVGGCTIARNTGIGRADSHHGKRLVSAAGEVWSRYCAWRRDRIAIRDFAALDDRLLRDIGVDRAAIRSLIYGRAQREDDSASDRPVAAPEHRVILPE